MRSTHIGHRLIRLDSVDSTNTYVRQLALQGQAEGLAVVSSEQTAGRGRRGRSFQSTKGLGLYLAVLLRPAVTPDQAADLTPWAAVAVCDGIQSACGVRPRIKWVNDLIPNGKKLCGILTESVLAPDGSLDCTVVGIGINVAHTPEDFDPDIRHMATSLAMELGHPVDATELARHILQALDRLYARFPQDNPAVAAQYRADCLTPGHEVRLVTPAGTQEAEALEVDDAFRLVVRLPDGTRQALCAGEVSVRGMYDYL